MAASQRRDPDSGRVAVPEIAELLYLQRPAAAVAASVVVLLALLVALVAPGLLPANVLTGALVGVLAVLAAVAAAVALDGRDPVLRGPRHLRRDGHTVLARMAGADAVRHGAPVLTALERRLDGRGHHSVVLTGTGTDPSALAVALGRGAAADGHTALVIDLRAQVAPGVADVGAGTVRLGEAAQLADDRPYAWIGAGVDREAAAEAAAAVARRPPRDLELLLVVAPEAATHVPAVLQACERTVLLVDADAQQRSMVSARMEALERAGGRPEAVVVGGLRVGDDHGGEIDTAAPAAHAPSDAAPATASAAAAATATAPAADEPTTEPAVPPSPEPAPGPEPPPTVPEPADPEEPEPSPAPEPGPDAPPIVVPDPEDAAPAEQAGPGGDDHDDRDKGHERDEREQGGERDERHERADPDTDVGTDEPQRRLEDTGPMRPIAFRTAGGDTSMDGLADDDPLARTVALEQLLAQRHGEGA